MKPVDLHTHSNASDGTDSPSTLVGKGAEAGLGCIAITDHDSTAGLPEAMAAGKALGLQIVRGCEISTSTEYGEMHILGLWLPERIKPLDALLSRLRLDRERRSRTMLAKLNALGFEISMRDIAADGSGSLGRPHIARAMLEKGYVDSIGDAFRLYLAKGRPAWEARHLPQPASVVELLASLGACVSLAHPFLIRCPMPWLERHIAMLREAGLTAIEAWHSAHDKANVEQALSLAGRYGLLLTGGSDYHGRNKPGVMLGRWGNGKLIPGDILERLRSFASRESSRNKL